MKNIGISIIGTGYVGLITGITFAKKGYNTICVDILSNKIEKINRGESPFYEPNIDNELKEVIKEGRLIGTTNLINAINKTNITFITVNTPLNKNGSTDLSSIKTVSTQIGMNLKQKRKYHVVVVKSTVPPGTCNKLIIPEIEKSSGKNAGENFGFCMNPEFLREGEALYDSYNPDKIIIGEYDKKSGNYLQGIYKKFSCPKINCSITTAETIKYAANSFLSTKISFANEFSRICEELNIDVYEVMKCIGLDPRIGPYFLNSGVGFGGSCFPKDVKSIISIAKEMHVNTPLLKAVMKINETQPLHLIEIMSKTIGEIREKKVAFLGLAFKPNTDDVRETTALPIIKELIKNGAIIKAYDPLAMNNFKDITNLPIEYVENWKKALQNADIVIINTEWEEFKNISADDFKKYMKKPIIIDGRRTYNPMNLISKGIIYKGIGWKNND